MKILAIVYDRGKIETIQLNEMQDFAALGVQLAWLVGSG